jgi:hypothetical protein
MRLNARPQHADPLDDLLARTFVDLDASHRHCEAGDIPDALGSLARVLEGVLLGALLAHEEAVREAGRWPRKEPTRLHLSELVVLAQEMRWLGAPTVEQCKLLNEARSMAQHPGALVRERESSPAFTTPYEDFYFGVVKACEELFAAHGALPGEHGV